MVYVELPEVGATVTKKETFGVVESVKVRLSPPPASPLARCCCRYRPHADIKFPLSFHPPHTPHRDGDVEPYGKLAGAGGERRVQPGER